MAYIVLPKDVSAVGHLPAEWEPVDFESADQAAAEVVRSVRDEIFWPPKSPPPAFSEDLAAICQDHRFAAAGVAGITEGEETHERKRRHDHPGLGRHRQDVPAQQPVHRLGRRQQPLDGILATTFTRKAAGEILDRVLVRLAEAALAPKKLAELARYVGGPPLDCGRCLGLLRDMVRHLHRLRIGTLDSFFVEIAQSFGLELGFPPGWSIAEEIDDEAMRADAVRTVLEKGETGDVVRLMHRLTKGTAARSVSEQIGDLVKGLYAIYCEAPAEAWKSLPRTKQLGAEELRAVIDALGAVELPADKRFQNAINKDRETITGGDDDNWEYFLGKGIAAGVLDGTETYCKKAIPEDALAVYRQLVEHAKAVLRARIVERTEATWELLQGFDAEYQRLKASRRSLRFEDVTRRLGDRGLGDRLEEVVYRLDGQVAHLLLDEFQDTSALQWRVLRPFAQRVVGGGADRSLFCVGDIKQAIYAWRGGVAEIFDAVDDEFGPLPAQALNQSFRSSPVVIDCVNRIFAGVAGNPALQGCPAAAQKW